MILNTYKNFKKAICFLLGVAVLNLTLGCTHYNTRAISKSLQNPGSNNQFIKRDYAILHYGGKLYKITEMKADEHGLYGKTQIWDGSVTKTDSSHLNLNSHYTVDEVHFHVKSDTGNINTNIFIPVKSIELIDIINTNTHEVVKSIPYNKLSAGAWVAIILVSLIGIIFLLIKLSCGCPFVHQFDGETYQLSGEAYGGAIYPNLERDDYLLLPDMLQVNGNYQIRISNKLEEKQYTDLARLLVVEHPENTMAYIDKYGNVLTTTNQFIPEEAIASDHNNYIRSVTKKDHDYFSFSDQAPGNEASSIIMSFNKPKGSSEGKLIVSAGNTLWADYVFNEFLRLSGSKYNEFVAKEEMVPAKKHIQWMTDQKIPLMVYVETNKGWEFADYYYPTGSYSSREMAMRIDLSKVKDQKQVRIKIETGFMFWNLDYAAMDFSENVKTQVIDLPPSTAINVDSTNQVLQLSLDDGVYMEHLHKGDEVTIRYPATIQTENTIQTVYLHSKGHYQQIKNFDNGPDIKTLKSFKKPGRLIQFSKEKYTEMMKDYVSQK